MANISFVNGKMTVSGEQDAVAKYIYLVTKYLCLSIELEYCTEFLPSYEGQSLAEIKDSISSNTTLEFSAVGRGSYDCNVEYQLVWLRKRIEAKENTVDYGYLQDIIDQGLNISYDYTDECVEGLFHSSQEIELSEQVLKHFEKYHHEDELVQMKKNVTIELN